MKKVKNFLKAIKRAMDAPFELDDNDDTYQVKHILQAPFFLGIGTYCVEIHALGAR